MRDVSLIPSLLIDAKTLAREYLSVSLATVWRWKESGRLPPAISLSRQVVRWRREDVLRWIDAGCPPQNEQCAAVNHLPVELGAKL